MGGKKKGGNFIENTYKSAVHQAKNPFSFDAWKQGDGHILTGQFAMDGFNDISKGLGMGGESEKVKGFEMPGYLANAEQAMINRQNLIASGKAPSIAEMGMRQNMDTASAQSMALAASQRGASNPALAFRQAQIANQQMGLEGSQQAAMLGEQERRTADQNIGAQAASQRGVSLQQSALNQQAATAQNNQNMQMLSGLGTAAMMYSASDENAKKNIEPKKYAMEEIQAFVEAIKPSTYEYKNSKHGSGEKMGVMAQDLEKSEIGRTMVDKAPDGTKMVDTNKATGALLAAMADMAERIKKLEK